MMTDIMLYPILESLEGRDGVKLLLLSPNLREFLISRNLCADIEVSCEYDIESLALMNPGDVQSIFTTEKCLDLYSQGALGKGDYVYFLIREFEKYLAREGNAERNYRNFKVIISAFIEAKVDFYTYSELTHSSLLIELSKLPSTDCFLAVFNNYSDSRSGCYKKGEGYRSENLLKLYSTLVMRHKTDNALSLFSSISVHLVESHEVEKALLYPLGLQYMRNSVSTESY